MGFFRNYLPFRWRKISGFFDSLRDFLFRRISCILDPSHKEVTPMTQETIRPGRWRHFKGNEYQVLGLARHSETLEDMVVYRALYGDGGLWVRPASMWLEAVDRDGYRGPRFVRIGD